MTKRFEVPHNHTPDTDTEAPPPRGAGRVAFLTQIKVPALERMVGAAEESLAAHGAKLRALEELRVVDPERYAAKESEHILRDEIVTELQRKLGKLRTDLAATLQELDKSQ